MIQWFVCIYIKCIYIYINKLLIYDFNEIIYYISFSKILLSYYWFVSYFGLSQFETKEI